jgi:hypothetical protein
MAELSEADRHAEADISAKQRVFEESELLLRLYRALIENRDLGSGLRSALEIVCQFTGWVVGTAWLPAENETEIRICSSWHRDDPNLAEFIALANSKHFAAMLASPAEFGIAKERNGPAI